MKKIFFVSLCAVVLSACSKIGSKAEPSPLPEYVENEEGSKIYDITSYTHPDIPGYLLVDTNPDGTATLVIDVVSGDTTDIQPASIHQGSCSDEKIGNLLYPLNDLGDGMSGTPLDMSVEEFVAKDNLKLVIKKSKEESDVVTACGDL